MNCTQNAVIHCTKISKNERLTISVEFTSGRFGDVSFLFASEAVGWAGDGVRPGRILLADDGADGVDVEGDVVGFVHGEIRLGAVPEDIGHFH